MQEPTGAPRHQQPDTPLRHPGKPKGVVHCTGGYMVYTYTTTKYVFNMAPEDVYW